ncbi:unnamed protein product [Allacma fusca]|uniref:Uncharacterized protein n=1 Tax=Allacma fusca TaxID=39272 RepID=A0A8J2K5M0_9HEXA|nr:unnamed protein product [Allacma fusca]
MRMAHVHNLKEYIPDVPIPDEPEQDYSLDWLDNFVPTPDYPEVYEDYNFSHAGDVIHDEMIRDVAPEPGVQVANQEIPAVPIIPPAVEEVVPEQVNDEPVQPIVPIQEPVIIPERIPRSRDVTSQGSVASQTSSRVKKPTVKLAVDPSKKSYKALKIEMFHSMMELLKNEDHENDD